MKKKKKKKKDLRNAPRANVRKAITVIVAAIGKKAEKINEKGDLMIDRELVNKCLDVMEKISDESVDLTIYPTGKIDLKIYPKNWWNNAVQWTDERRHEVLALVTPLTGKLNKEVDGVNIGYRGEKDSLSVRMNYIDKCKIVGYRIITKKIKKEIEDPEPEYEEVEEKQKIPITDCDIRTGKFKEGDIEMPA